MRPISSRVICIPAGSWDNINGPAVIEIPESFEDRLGKYYMYYANHAGKEIRLAYANHPLGPWVTHVTPALRLEDTPCDGHIASPDVKIVDNKVHMRFHGPYKESQQTFFARSENGIDFKGRFDYDDPIFTFYFKWFYVNNWPWGIAKNRNIGGEIWELAYVGGCIDPYKWTKKMDILPNMRHGHAVYRGDEVIIYYTRIGDSLECIRRTVYSFPDFQQVSDVEVLAPELVWEGAKEKIEKSKPGAVYGLHNQLRDPHILQSSDGIFLYYAAGGENCIGCVQLDSI